MNLKHKNRAIQLTNVLAVDPPAPPSERLLHVLIRGLNQESEEKAAEDKVSLIYYIRTCIAQNLV